ncbi:MAG: hypothetical protein QM676_03830 [Novosphingobium sp.]
MFRAFSLLPLTLAACALAGCGGETAAPDARKQPDPAIVAALADPIMIDPDLASQNRGNAAIALARFDGVPLEDASPEAIEAARSEASRLAGGLLRTAPEPAEAGKPEPPAVTAGELAAALTANPAGCLDGLRYGYAWAAQFPAALPIYPRGHVQEAAGNAGCGLLVAVFTTPVEPQAVLDFYFTKAGDAGYGTNRRRAGEVEVLSGSKGRAAYLVRIRPVDGLSQVELAVRG